MRKQEIERGVTLVGPHRDDLLLKLGRLPAKGYASHGESWSYALALRLASYDLLRAEGNEPVLVLDDVFAELDARRRERLAELVAPGEQVLVTAAVDDDVPGVLAGRAVRGGGRDGGARMSERTERAARAAGRRPGAVGRRPGAGGAAGGQGAGAGAWRRGRSRRSRRGGGGLRSGARADGRDPLPLGAAINRLITERGWETPAAVGGVMGRWPQIVGAEVAKHCVPRAVRRGRAGADRAVRLHGVGDAAAAAGPAAGGPAQRGPRARHGEADQGAGPGGPPAATARCARPAARARRHLRVTGSVRGVPSGRPGAAGRRPLCDTARGAIAAWSGAEPAHGSRGLTAGSAECPL